MCEANVYLMEDGSEKLVMEKVDRLVPGDENNIYMENIFGERKVIQARIKELQLVHHKIILDEIPLPLPNKEQEIWLTLNTEHGHFHAGEDISLNVFKGYNMKPDTQAELTGIQVFAVVDRQHKEYPLTVKEGKGEVNLGNEADGVLRIFAQESGEKEVYATIWAEVGHHHHHGVEPIGLPVEILPAKDQHARIGENYEIQVLKNGQPMPDTRVRVTYTATSSSDYPHQLTTDHEGRARIFLSAKGNYLFSVQDADIISTFTLIKSF